jgi:hypothetical protein
MKTRHFDISQRGHGFTTLQMQRAPQGALFIWPAQNSINYARSLAAKLGRGDLEIVPPSILEGGGVRLRGKRYSAVVLDHACEPSPEEYELLRELRPALVH